MNNIVNVIYGYADELRKVKAAITDEREAHKLWRAVLLDSLIAGIGIGVGVTVFWGLMKKDLLSSVSLGLLASVTMAIVTKFLLRMLITGSMGREFEWNFTDNMRGASASHVGGIVDSLGEGEMNMPKYKFRPEAEALDLPDGRIIFDAQEIKETHDRALAAYKAQRMEIEQKYPKGTWILIDSDDPTGCSYIAGEDMLSVEQEFFVQYKKPLHTAHFFRVGEQ